MQLSALMVALDVYLSTGTGNKTGIGTRSPVTTLDVNGNAQFGSGTTKSTFTAAGVLRLATQLGVPYGGTGATTLTSGGILYGAGTGAISALPVLTNGQLLIGDNSGAPAAATLTGTSNQVTVNTGAGTISLSLPQNIHTAADPAFNSLSLTTPLTVGNGGTGAASLAGVLKGNTAGAFTAMTGTANRVTRWSDANTVAASGILTDNGTRFTVGAAMDVTGSLTTSSSGTFKATTGYSIDASSGILIRTGIINMSNNGKIINLDDPQVAQDAATKGYVDAQIGGVSGVVWHRTGDSVTLGTNKIGSTNATDLEIITGNTPRITVTSAGAIQFSSALGVLYGGTGSSTADGARTNLELGSIATQDSTGVSITGGTITDITDLAVTDGGTGAGTPAGARTNLGLGSIATQDSTGVSITGGTITGITDLAVADGGTGAGTPAGARTNLGLGSGLSSTYTIATTTSTTGTPCQNWTFSNGILITVSAGFACP